MDSAISHDGEVSKRSTNISNGETTWIETSIYGAGRLSFWWKASTESYADEIYDYINQDGYNNLDSWVEAAVRKH